MSPRPLVFALPGFAALRPAGEEIEPGALTVDRFANGEMRIRLLTDPSGRHCALVGSVAPPAGQLVTFLLAADTLRRHRAGSVTAVLPYLAYARQDRPEAGFSLAAAWLGAALAASGVDRVVTVDVHSDAAAELLALPVVSLSPARVVAGGLRARAADVVVVAPDAGAIARGRRLAEALGVAAPVAWLEKRRAASGVAHGRLVGELAAHAVVVDDILDTGGTLVSCCAELQRRGVQTIVCAVTHGLFSGRRWRALPAVGVTEVHITDTVPDVVRRSAPLPVQVHAVTSLVYGALVDAAPPG